MRSLALLLFVPAAFALFSTAYADVVNGYPLLRVHYNCSHVVAAVNFLGPKDAWLYKKQVIELDDDTVTVYVEENKLKKVVTKIKVGDGFKRVAYDGERPYVCGDVCKAFNLRGEELWTSHVSFEGDLWTSLGLYRGLLFVVTKGGLAAINTTNGKVEHLVKSDLRGASFCKGLVALRGNDWLALLKGKEVLWTLKAEWSPEAVVFSNDCKYLFVNDFNKLYAIRVSDGKVVDKHVSDEFVAPLEACYEKGGYVVTAEEFDWGLLSSSLTDWSSISRGIPILLKVYVFTPSQSAS